MVAIGKYLIIGTDVAEITQEPNYTFVKGYKIVSVPYEIKLHFALLNYNLAESKPCVYDYIHKVWIGIKDTKSDTGTQTIYVPLGESLVKGKMRMLFGERQNVSPIEYSFNTLIQFLDNPIYVKLYTKSV